MEVGDGAEKPRRRCLHVSHFVIILFFVKPQFARESGTLRGRLESRRSNMQLQGTVIVSVSYAKSRDV
jgi:hypothetical protein